MITYFAPIKSFYQVKTVSIGNKVSVLHHRVTVLILIMCSMLTGWKDNFGSSISCSGDSSNAVSDDALNSFCWVHSTYTVSNEAGEEYGPYPGVMPLDSKNNQVKYHRYYIWVPLVLLSQAILFYVPRILWKAWEGGRISSLVTDLTCPIDKEEDKQCKLKKLVAKYFIRNLNNHNFYAFQFFLSEVLAFINVIGQMFLMEAFLGFEFKSYGSNVLAMIEQDSKTRTDPMSKFFPKMTKCTYKRTGPGGNTINYDALCTLTYNVINEKVYVFLWFWFIILAAISAVSLIYRLFTIFSMQVRINLVRAMSPLSDPKQVEMVVRKCRIGDWFLLHQLGKNMDSLIYPELIAELTTLLGEKEEKDKV